MEAMILTPRPLTTSCICRSDATSRRFVTLAAVGAYICILEVDMHDFSSYLAKSNLTAVLLNDTTRDLCTGCTYACVQDKTAAKRENRSRPIAFVAILNLTTSRTISLRSPLPLCA